MLLQKQSQGHGRENCKSSAMDEAADDRFDEAIVKRSDLVTGAARRPVYWWKVVR